MTKVFFFEKFQGDQCLLNLIKFELAQESLLFFTCVHTVCCILEILSVIHFYLKLNYLKPRRPSSGTSEVPNRSQDVPQIDPDVPDLVNPIITKLMDHIIDSKSSEQDVIDNSERFLSRFRKELNNKRECNVQKLSNDYTGDLERTENGIRDFSQGSTDAPSVVVPFKWPGLSVYPFLVLKTVNMCLEMRSLIYKRFRILLRNI